MSDSNAGRFCCVNSRNRSKTGLVNVYGSECTKSDLSGLPKPLKTIGNLTTSISTMRFNHDAQILALASKSKKDQLKMVNYSWHHVSIRFINEAVGRCTSLP